MRLLDDAVITLLFVALSIEAFGPCLCSCSLKLRINLYFNPRLASCLPS
jgi:hypothetical protein